MAPGMTVLPLSTTLTVLPLTVISKWFHWPTGLSAWVRGVTAARTSARCFGIRPHAIHLARSNRPAPDVHLKPAVATKEDARIRVRKRQPQLIAFNVLGVGAVGQDIGNILIDEWCFLEPPIQLQDEVAIFAIAPERFVPLGLAAAS